MIIYCIYITDCLRVRPNAYAAITLSAVVLMLQNPLKKIDCIFLSLYPIYNTVSYLS